LGIGKKRTPNSAELQQYIPAHRVGILNRGRNNAVDRPKQCDIGLVQIAATIVRCDSVQHCADRVAKLFRQVRDGML
jgi:hypothetical protein